jgi:hypothetical protein
MRTKKAMKIAHTMFFIIVFALSLTMTSFASDLPEGVDTTQMNEFITVIFWAVRLLIAGVGGIPSIIKIVQGQTDEMPRERNAGIAGAVATGIGVAATFAIESIFF